MTSKTDMNAENGRGRHEECCEDFGERAIVTITHHRARAEKAERALRGLFALIENGTLVRDTSRDHEPLWSMRQLPLLQALADAEAALREEPETCGRGPTDPSPLPEGVTLDPIDLGLYTRTYVAEAKETMGLLAGRCEMCDWPLYESMDKGCTVGSCSYRPSQPSEVARLRERRRSLDALNRLTKLADATVRLAGEVERLTVENERLHRALREEIAKRSQYETDCAVLRAKISRTPRTDGDGTNG